MDNFSGSLWGRWERVGTHLLTSSAALAGFSPVPVRRDRNARRLAVFSRMIPLNSIDSVIEKTFAHDHLESYKQWEAVVVGVTVVRDSLLLAS
jgi:hypothetical protein